MKLLFRAFCCILLCCALAQDCFARPAQVILLRHAEKPLDESNLHLSDQGRDRAKGLAQFLTSNKAVTNAGLPSVLFATKVSRRGHSQRPSETLQPLAERLNLVIQTPYSPEDYLLLAKKILNDPAFDGKNVVVCWVHDYLPQFASALGAKSAPQKWKATVFDRAWLITWTDKKVKLKDIPQRLLPGDVKK